MFEYFLKNQRFINNSSFPYINMDPTILALGFRADSVSLEESLQKIGF